MSEPAAQSLPNDATENTSEQAQAPPVRVPRKRKRIVISCTECHRRKQKCDRGFPCSNCVSRNKQSACHYENEAARKQQLLEDGTPNPSSDESGSYGVMKLGQDSTAQLGVFGYAKANGSNNTTMGIFSKIENHGAGNQSILSSPTSIGFDNSGLREKYKNLIRQLPPKAHIEKLLVTYFREVNYQYYPLDEGVFREHLENWYNLSFSTLNKGPLELSGDLRFFPALLFQCLALALHYQPTDYDTALDSLKYAASMSLDDLANDYSDSGVSIMCLLGKQHTTLVTVQAGFLRTNYLKNCGLVTESWHALSTVIRDAQEIGLHKPNTAHSRNDRPESILCLWHEQLRRRMWLILSLWDIHMSIVLGRPATIDSRDGKPVFPLDTPVGQNRREVAPSVRTDSDPPTALSSLLWSAEISAPLWDIYNLEKEDKGLSNIPKVENMHRLINQITMHCPPYFQAEHPDTRFDSLPDCHWLPRARANFQNGVAFTIMALHRPYIFTNASSRTSALRAGLDILRAQRVLFKLIASKDYKMFSLVVNTFDAIVLVAAIYILHPYENREDLESTIQHFEWGMERFEVMSSRNSMAKSALDVLRAIHIRFKKALAPGKPPSKPAPPTASSTPTVSPPAPESTYPQPALQQPQYPVYNPNASASQTPSLVSVSGSGTGSTSSNSVSGGTPYTQPTISNLTTPTSISSSMPLPTTGSMSTWDPFSLQHNFDLSSMAPLQPMHDLLYRDLSTGGTPQINLDPRLAGLGEMGMMDANANAAWQFAGDFGTDSFWGFMNNYNP